MYNYIWKQINIHGRLFYYKMTHLIYFWFIWFFIVHKLNYKSSIKNMSYHYLCSSTQLCTWLSILYPFYRLKTVINGRIKLSLRFMIYVALCKIYVGNKISNFLSVTWRCTCQRFVFSGNIRNFASLLAESFSAWLWLKVNGCW